VTDIFGEGDCPLPDEDLAGSHGQYRRAEFAFEESGRAQSLMKSGCESEAPRKQKLRNLDGVQKPAAGFVELRGRILQS